MNHWPSFRHIRVASGVAAAALTLVFSSPIGAVSFDNPLIRAADMGQIGHFKQLVRLGNSVDSQNSFGVSSLMRASYRGNLEMVEWLLESGAEPNLQDVGGAAALHFAAQEGYPRIVRALLDAGADPNILDEEGLTPLMQASAAGHDSVVRQLVRRGAAVNEVDAWGQSAMVYAVSAERMEVAQLLLQSGADVVGAADIEGRNIGEIASDQPQMLAMLTDYVSEERTQGVVQETAPRQYAALQPSAGPRQDALPSQTIRTAAIAPPTEPEFIPLAARLSVRQASGEQRYAQAQPQANRSSEAAPGAAEGKTADSLSPASSVAAEPAVLLQLGTFPARDKAMAFWYALSQEHRDLMKNRKLHISEVKLPEGDQSLYRVQAGFFNNKEEAYSSCQQMKVRGIECFITESVLAASALPSASEEETKIAASSQPQAQPVQASAQESGRKQEAEVSSLAPAAGNVPEQSQERKVAWERTSEGELRFSAQGPSSVERAAAENAEANQLQTAQVTENETLPRLAPAKDRRYVNEAALPWLQKNEKANPVAPTSQPAANNAPPASVDSPVSSPVQPEQARPAPVLLPRANALVVSENRQPALERIERTLAPRRSEARMLNAPRRRDREELARRQPRPLGALRSPAPVASADSRIQPQVQVSEAVRVPLSRQPVPATEVTAPARKPQPPRPLVAQSIPRHSPAARAALGQGGTQYLWAQVGDFASSADANRYWRQLVRYNPALSQYRTRLQAPYNPHRAAPRIALQIGPMDAREVNAFCRLAATGGLSCREFVRTIAPRTAGVGTDSGREASSQRQPIYGRPSYAQANSMQQQGGTSYWVQLGSFSSDAAGRNQWDRWQAAHPDMLEKDRYRVVRPASSASARPIFRLQNGPFMSYGDAQLHCIELRKKGLRCIAVRG